MTAVENALDPGVIGALEHAGIAVDASTRRRAEYSTDASIYRVPPAAVVFPRHTDDLLAVLETCRASGTPLTMRGAGTSIAGNAVGPGVVVDVSKHLRTIHAIDPDSRTAAVDPGVVLDDLQRAAAPYGLRFGPDPSSHSRCTIGGMVGNNACGSRALAYGRTGDNVVGLDVVTGAGERLRARRGADPSSSQTLQSLHDLVSQHLGVIRTELGRFGRQVSGYSLEHLLPERGFDVARALVGTEGTLAVTLGATVRLVPSARMTTLVVLGYPDMASAADDVPTLLPLRPLAMEGLDERIIDVVRRHRGDPAVPQLPAGAGFLFVELGGESAGGLVAAAGQLVAASSAVGARVVAHAAEAVQLWRIREDGAGLASRPAGTRSAYSGWEDAAVPPDRLGAYLRDFEALLLEHGVAGVPYGHFGDGCVHVRLELPLRSAGGASAYRSFVYDAARLVARYGGSMSGEHGDGRARSELLPIMYSAEVINAFAAVKAIFDPADVLNPGVLVRPRPVEADIRISAVRRRPVDLALAYPDDDGDFTRAVHRCNGVGKCVSDITASGGVMCPSYLATHDEKDSTRGRARVLQEMVNGSLVKGWRSPEVHDALDLCLSCKGCATDCPTGIDMASYKAEVLHQTYRRRLRPASHYSLGWLPRWARLASRAPRLANALLGSPLSAIGKRVAGVDSRRSLPVFATQTFRAWFAGRPVAAGDPVVLWVDTFTDYFTPEVGKAAVGVLEDAGFSVRLPDGPVCCGLTWISTGQLDAARRQLRRSLAALAPHVLAGTPVVGLEPSCVAVFRGDAAALLAAEPDAARVGSSVRTLAEVLATRPGWQPPDLDGVSVVAQPHCHHHSVMGWTTDRALLEGAGATVLSAGGCCGLAGNFGVERGHYDMSVAIAEHALLPAVRDADPAAVVLTDGFSCRTQLADLAGRRAVHLAELLADRSAAQRE